MIRSMSLLVVAGLAVALPVGGAAAETMRQHEAHEHGHGRLNLVLDGTSLEAELVVPAFDIVGFEHAPANDAEREEIRKAVAAFQDAGRILGLPAAAECVVQTVSVENDVFDLGEPHGESEHHAGKANGHAEEEVHSEFFVEVSLTCAAPAALGGIEPGYFQAFERAEELEVQAVGPWGQAGGELTRQSPRLDF